MPKEELTVVQKNKFPTQQFLDILEIRDDCLVLKDGTLRAVLLVSSINFDLKSEEEQNAIIQGYVQFLNTFNFPFQIVIQSRRLDIDEYLERLKTREKELTNDLLKIQIKDYRQYVQELVEMADIMNKRFYLIVPYAPGKSQRKNFLTRLREVFSPTAVIKLKQKKFEKYKTELFKRVNQVISGLGSFGLRSTPLDTQSLIELFYNTYNPGVYRQQKLASLNKLIVEKESND